MRISWLLHNILYFFLPVLLLAGQPICAQDDEDSLLSNLQIHGFLNQGYMLSSDNNYLTLTSSEGSFEWQEVAVNLITSAADKLRFGLQVYARNLGELGDFDLQLDWAYVDYRWQDYLGFRLGKIKTPFGLYNDQQDLAFLHGWVLFPQSVYPTGQRSQNLSHIGVDVYGTTRTTRIGRLEYQLFGGTREVDKSDGFFKRFKDNGTPIESFNAEWLAGGNVNYVTPLDGLRIASGFLADKYEIEGRNTGNGNRFIRQTDGARTVYRFGLEYDNGTIVFAAEYDRQYQDLLDENLRDPLFGTGGHGSGTGSGQGGGQDGSHGGGSGAGGGTGQGCKGGCSGQQQGQINLNLDREAWYVSLQYRFNDRLQIGGYYSALIANRNEDKDDPQNYMDDIALHLRYDLSDYLTLRTEVHSVSGLAIGLLDSVNPDGYSNSWNILTTTISINF